jgi:hypothetical protein
VADYFSLPAELRRYSEAWRIENAAKGGAQGITGSRQWVMNPAGVWRAKLSGHLTDPDEILALRGFLASLDGPFSPFKAGPIDWRGQPWNVDFLSGAIITPNRFPGGGYESNPATGGGLHFALEEDVKAQDVIMKIRRTRGGLLKPGQYLQIGDRLHIIARMVAPDPPNEIGLAGPGVVGVHVRPWLRTDYPAGTPIEMGQPGGLMRLADPDQGQIEMTTSPVSDLSLDLVEYF